MKKKLLSRFSSMKGFTMIELLVVIAIIGVLAVAMLSAINPLEQINRGRDTRDRSDAAELLGGMERYYATKEAWPFTIGTGTDPIVVTDLSAIATALQEAEEVKAGFQTRLAKATKISMRYVVDTAENLKTYVCFTPASKQFQDQALKDCADRTTELKAIGNCPAASYATLPAWTTELICIP